MSVGGGGSSTSNCSGIGDGGAGLSSGGTGSGDGEDGTPNCNNVDKTIKQQQKKVCFICGSYTTFTINIYEPRSGPNIVDVINEKFKVQVKKNANHKEMHILM